MQFNIAVQIGNTNTQEPGRDYSCPEQLDVVKAVFGQDRLILPTNERMTVDIASQGQGYSSTDRGLYVANDGANRPLITEARWFDEPRFSGFLLTAIGESLVVARKSLMKRASEFAEAEKSSQDEPIFESLGELAHRILEYGVMGGVEDMEFDEGAAAVEEGHCQEVQELADVFLGSELAEFDNREGRFIDFIECLERSLNRNVFSLE